MVEADRQMLFSAIVNLLQNAFKFTKPHSHVSLSARAMAENVLIEVEDECGGLEEETRTPVPRSQCRAPGLEATCWWSRTKKALAL
jgi:K+-sensing histidine kinase KdpD